MRPLEFGVYHPKNVISSAEIESWGVKTGSGKSLTEADILKRTGVERRFLAAENESVIDMALEAVNKAEIKPSGIDIVFASTSYPTGENVASRIANELGIKIDDDGSNVRDFHMACTGYAGMMTALHKMQERYQGGRVLLVSTEKYSPTLVDLREEDAVKKDPSLSFTIFTDGAAVMAGTYGENFDIESSIMMNFGPQYNHLIRMPVNPNLRVMPYFDIPIAYSPKFAQEGNDVYMAVRTSVPIQIQAAIEAAGRMPQEIHGIVPHQGSRHIVEVGLGKNKTLEEVGLAEKIVCDYADGNLSSGSIPRALARLHSDGKLDGKRMVLSGFGAGLAASTVLVNFRG